MRRLRDTGLLALSAALLAGGVALAQGKPPPVGAPTQPGQPGSKFAPAPAPVPPPQFDKFASPPAVPPTPGPAPQADKFGQPPAVVAPAPLPPTAAAPLPAPPIPADEPAALTQFRALLGPDVVLTYRSAESTDPAGAGVRLTEAALRRPDGQIAAEELVLERPRPDGIAGAMAQNLTVTDAKGTVTSVARMELRELSVTRPAPGESLRPDQLSVGRLRLESLAVQGETAVAIAEVLLEDYRSGQPGRVSLGGLDVLLRDAGAVDRVRIRRVALEGIDLAGTLAAVVAEQTPPRPPAGYSAVVEGVALSKGDQPVGALDALRLTGTTGQGGTTDIGRLALDGLRVEPFPAIADWLKRLGYGALTGDLSTESRYDPAAGRLELIGLAFGLRDAAALGLSFTLEGLTADAMAARRFETAALAGFTLRYLDQSLLRRLAQAEATRTRRPERQIREDWANLAAGSLGKGGPAAALLGPLQRVLRGQAQEVTLTARPPQPVPVSELPAAAMDAAAAQQRLGLSATAR